MIRSILRNAGVRPSRLIASLLGWKRYFKERSEYRKLADGLEFPWDKEMPILTEWDEASGGMGAYFLQDLSVARLIRGSAPKRHVDVGSRVDGFVGNVASFRDIEVLDIRPAKGEVAGVKFHQVDLMEELTSEWIGCTESLSCLHTIEHFGLGRYGDRIDPNGHLRGLQQLKRILAVGGLLYLSTPIGPQRIVFNAHRVFSMRTMIDWFPSEDWQIEKLLIIDDDNQLHHLSEWSDSDVDGNFGCNLGVGIIVVRKLGSTD